MKYLKLFENDAAYNAAESGLILPNVSVCVNENHVHYNPSSPTPPTPSHEYVDLGLPSGTKWATMNVGATGVTDFGDYYQYGKGADAFSITSGESRYSGTENPLAASADTATQAWGSSWHMPTYTQFEELTGNTTYEWTTIDGINGGKFTAQNGNYVFFPATGYYYHQLSNVGNLCYLLSSTPDGDTYCVGLSLMDGFCDTEQAERFYGCPVRPVMDT